MKYKLAFVVFSALVVGCATTSTDQPTEAAALDASGTVANVACSDIIFTGEVKKRFPEIDQACRGVVRDADGDPYIKIGASVHSVRRDLRTAKVSSVTLNMLHTKGDQLRYLTVKPPRDFRYTVDGKMKTADAMDRGQKLNMYLPPDRWELAWDIETAIPVDTEVYVEDIETYLVTTSMDADESFEFGSAELTDEGKADLAGIYDAIGEYVPLVTIFGYTDMIGSEQYNLDLSQRRADAARDHLVSLGVPANRVEAVGRGESNPIVGCVGMAGEELKTCLSPNRRTEVIFMVPAVADAAVIDVTKTYVDPLGRPVITIEQLGVAQMAEISDMANEMLDACDAEITNYCDRSQAGDGRILGCLSANMQAGYDYSASCDAAMLLVLDAVTFRRTRLNAVGRACSVELAACDAAPLGTKLDCVALQPKSEVCTIAMDLLATSAF